MKKKIFIIMLACVMIMAGSISVYAVVEACSHNYGTAMGLISHTTYGYDGCIATERYYCDRCDETMYIATDVTYTTCPTWHTRYPNWQ